MVLASRTSPPFLFFFNSIARPVSLHVSLFHRTSISTRTGKLLHIDFGDCFEASMHRDKFPERVPFRLTRMMVKAMEVSGIEGNFRATCNEVMRVLRQNKDSAMAMLEAFVHDPLINWRLLNTPADGAVAAAVASGGQTIDSAPNSPGPGPAIDVGIVGSLPAAPIDLRNGAPSPPRRDLTKAEVLAAYGGAGGDATEALNERAVTVMRRMGDKLTGRDFSPDGGVALIGDPDSVPQQVQRLVAAATSHENLCQSYIGWCAFW
jgi:serine/threonine-protein kinase mTOR